MNCHVLASTVMATVILMENGAIANRGNTSICIYELKQYVCFHMQRRMSWHIKFISRLQCFCDECRSSIYKSKPSKYLSAKHGLRYVHST